MDSVGTDIGNAHRQRMGTGLSYILQGDQAVDTYRRINEREWMAAQRRDAERRAKRDAALSKLRATDPPFFYKHMAEKKAMQDEIMRMGVDIFNANGDPFNDVTPQAIEFQRKYNKLMSMSDASKQIGQQFNGLQQELMGGKAEDYSADDIARAVSFYDKPLQEIVDNRLVPPTLQKKAPAMEMSDFIGKRMAEWQKSSGRIPTDNEIESFIDATASDGDNQQKFIAGYGSKLLQMDEQERKDLEARAKAASRETWQQMAFEDAKRWQKKAEPLDITSAYNKASDLAAQGVSYKEWSTPAAFGSAPVKGSKEAAIMSAVNAEFNSDDRWMTIFDEKGELPRGAEETDAEYAKRVKTYMATQIAPLVKTKVESGRTDKGETTAKQTQSRQDFLADIRSGDWRRMQGAANILIGTPYSGNMRIENATVTQGENNFWLELDLGTNVTPKEVKDQTTDPTTGLTSDNTSVENRQGRTVVKISLDPNAIENQTFIRLHDNMFNQNKQPYETKFTERTPSVYDATDVKQAITPMSQPNKNKPLYDASYFNQ